MKITMDKKMKLTPSLLFASLWLGSCERIGPERCSVQEEALCEGDTLRSCDPSGFVVFEECSLGCVNLVGDDTCDVCGNELIEDPALQCDDGKQCEGGAACQEDADCAGQGDERCLPRDGDDCPADCVFPICGDGVIEDNKGEACDDGNSIEGDGCRADCLGEEVCGDGQTDAVTGEACDDGNLAAGDGCDASCVIEFCGDNIVNNNEECELNEVGCSASCIFVTCGDGIQEEGEQCDDNNTTNGDGCSDICQLEGCGNGLLDLGEVCDDNNTTNGDGCDNDCQLTCDNLGALFQTGLSVTDPETGHCYLIAPQPRDWNIARASCENLNSSSADFRGHLVTLTSDRENTFVRSILSEVELWIGLTDQDNNIAPGSTEASFRWVTGERLSSFIGFGGNEPSDSFGEDCVHFINNNFAWNDNNCADNKLYVCEFDFGKQCGNGIIEGGEVCDDNNNDNDDTCSNTCTFNACNTTTTGAAQIAVSPFSDGCFALYNISGSWDDAFADCEERGGFLATTAISTGAITSENATADTIVNNDVWIGLRDTNVEDLFQWVNGEAVTFNNFDGGQPDNLGNEDCVEMKGNGRWNDNRCSATRGSYLCEF